MLELDEVTDWEVLSELEELVLEVDAASESVESSVELDVVLDDCDVALDGCEDAPVEAVAV